MSNLLAQLQNRRFLYITTFTGSSRASTIIDNKNRGGCISIGGETHNRQGGDDRAQGRTIRTVRKEYQFGDIDYDNTMIPNSPTIFLRLRSDTAEMERVIAPQR